MTTQIQESQEVTEAVLSTDGFGVHLTVDGYGGNQQKLADKEVLLELLEDLVVGLGMHKIIEPVTVEVGPNNKKDPGGLSGFVMVAESHISIHTFPAVGFISADVYTCNDAMNTAVVVKKFQEAYDLDDDVETNFIRRGQRFPKHLL